MSDATNSPLAPLTNSLVNETRTAPPFGGFNFKAIALDVRRVLRNRRTLMFTLVFPNLFFYLFGMAGGRQRGGPEVLAMIMINMAVYGAMVSTTSGGAAVALDRALGWSRQLRLTPLSPVAYIAMRVFVSMVLAAMAITSTYLFGAYNGVHLTLQQFLMSGLASWSASCVFAAFGVLMVLLLPSDNVMQFVGPLLAVMAMFGGIFIPLKALPESLQNAARYTPMFGVGTLARWPVTGEISAWAISSLIFWTLLFGAAAMVLFRRDTQRV